MLFHSPFRVLSPAERCRPCHSLEDYGIDDCAETSVSSVSNETPPTWDISLSALVCLHAHPVGAPRLGRCNRGSVLSAGHFLLYSADSVPRAASQLRQFFLITRAEGVSPLFRAKLHVCVGLVLRLTPPRYQESASDMATRTRSTG